MHLKQVSLVLILLFSKNILANSECSKFLTNKLFKDDNKILDYTIQPNGQKTYFRKTKVGFEQTVILITTPSNILIEALKLLLAHKMYELWLHSIHRIITITKMSDRKFNKLFPFIKRDLLDLYRIISYFNIHTDGLPINIKDNLKWRNPSDLMKHFNKHGKSEFNAKTPDDYLKLAKEFARRPDGDATLTFKIRDQTYLKYNNITFEVLIIESSQITTYYRLTEAYRTQKMFDKYISEILFR